MRDHGPLVFLDFETRSEADLGRVGGRAYVRHPSTELLCGVAVVLEEGYHPQGYRWAPYPGPQKCRRPAPPKAGATVPPALAGIAWDDTWLSDDPHPEVFEAASRGTVIAHNWHGFDGPMWRALGYPPPLHCADSLDRARRASLPGKLDDIGKYLFGMGKDVGGHKLMMRHCKPTKAGGKGSNGQKAGEFLDPCGAALDGILYYCARDVLLLAAAWLGERLGAPHCDDTVLHTHTTIDARGIPIDLAYAARLAAAEKRMTGAALEAAAAHGVGETLLRSSSVEKGLPHWLGEHGFSVSDVQAGTVESLLAKIEQRIALIQGGAGSSPVASVTQGGK